MFSRYLSIVLVTAIISSLTTALLIKPEMFSRSSPESTDRSAVMKRLETLTQRQNTAERDQRGLFAKLENIELLLSNQVGKTPSKRNRSAKNSQKGNRSKKNETVAPAKNGKKLSRYDQLHAAFKKDKVDRQWSATALNQINQAVSSNAHPSSQVVFVECRSIICRLEIKIKDQKEAEVFVEKLSRALNWKNSSMEIYYRDEKQFVVEVFILRNSNSV